MDRALDPALRDFNFDQRSAGQLDPEAIFSLCTTLPMMAERRVVVLREVEGWKRKPKTRAAFLKYLERPAVETVVILVQSAAEESEDKDLVRGAFAVACEPLPAERARRWLLRRAAALGVTLEDAAADHLLAATGGELGAVAAELQKLAALPAGTPLTAEQVGALVGIRHGETIYDWRDAALDGDAGRAAAMTGPLLDQPGVTGGQAGDARRHQPRRRGPGAEPSRPRHAGREPRAAGVRPAAPAPAVRPAGLEGRERALGALGRRAGRPRGCARGSAPRGTLTWRSRAPRSPTSGPSSSTWSSG